VTIQRATERLASNRRLKHCKAELEVLGVTPPEYRKILSGYGEEAFVALDTHEYGNFSFDSLEAISSTESLPLGLVGYRAICGRIYLIGHTKIAKVPKVTPPINAEFLFHLLMSPQNCDAIVGDLEEHYWRLYKKFGRRRANFWYWFQTCISLRPIIWAAMKKPLATLAGMAAAKGLIGHDGWIAMLIEFMKKVRS
jgi:hypothetical protein